MTKKPEASMAADNNLVKNARRISSVKKLIW